MLATNKWPVRAVGCDLVGPVEQLGIDTVAHNQPVNRYWPERPHLSQVMRSTASLPTMSRKMIAPSRGISQSNRVAEFQCTAQLVDTQRGTLPPVNAFCWRQWLAYRSKSGAIVMPGDP